MKMDASASLVSPFPWRRLKSVNYHLLQQLLHLWIRPTIINGNAEKLRLDPRQPVCYVFPSRSLADLLVVDQACEASGLHRPHTPISTDAGGEQRSFFFLAHGEGRFFKRRSMRIHSQRMLRLLDCHTADPSLGVQLVPVSLFWGHAPEREGSLFRLLLSDSWVATNRLKKFLAVVFQPRHILVQFSEPISLRVLVDSETGSAMRARKLSRILRVHFRRRKHAIIGPDLSHSRTLLASLLSSTPVQEAIAGEATRQGISHQQAEAIAREHANELTAQQSYRVIRFLYMLLTWFWNKLYRGFVVGNIERVQELAQDNELVYVPCHRSHTDYLILSYLLYLNGLSLPHIAAGKNMNIPLVGPILRRGGAFFMRRSFQGDPLYKAVFDEYLHMIFTRGHAVEYFIEGGRSRTGRTLVPRTGMLSMTIRSFQRKSSTPLLFMPVYFGYERILEAGTYIGELQGAPKRDESVLDILRAFRFLSLEFGKVHVNFGQPVSLAAFLDGHMPGWENPASISQDRFRSTCVELAHLLATRINQTAAVTPVNLLAIVLLATPRQRMAEAGLLRQLEICRQLLLQPRYSQDITITDLSPAEIVKQCERMSIVDRLTQPLEDVLSAQGNLAILLTYYRNNIAHLFAIPSLIARLVIRRDGLSRGQILGSCSKLYPYIEAEYFLRWHEEELESICCDYLDGMARLGLVDLEDSLVRTPAAGTDGYSGLLVLAQIIEPTLQRFFIVGSLLRQLSGLHLTQEFLERNCQQIAQTIAAICGFNAPEFFQPSLFSTFLSCLINQDAVVLDHDLLLPDIGLVEILDTIEPLLDADVRQSVLESTGDLQRKYSAGTHQNGSSGP